MSEGVVRPPPTWKVAVEGRRQSARDDGRENAEARDERDVSHQGAGRKGRMTGPEGCADRARMRLEKMPNDASREKCWIERAGGC